VKKHDCVAEDAVPCELFSAGFPANRERYREYRTLIRNASEISPYPRALWRKELAPRDESEQGSNTE